MLRQALTRLREGGPAKWGRYSDPERLCHDHFRARSSLDHKNYPSFRALFGLMGGRPLTMLETGSSAWGTDSTRLFDSYLRSFGGSFATVDIRPEPREHLAPLVSDETVLAVDDSVAFLERWVADHPGEQADVVYLDSWDVDFSDPQAAAEHCLRELEAIEPALQPGSLLLIDDSPGSLEDVPGDDAETSRAIHARTGAWPGKGMLAQGYLENRGVELLAHGYQALYRF